MRILTDRYFTPSVRILRDQLEYLSGKRFIISTNPDRLRKPPEIRYGTTVGSFGNDEYGINSPEVIALVANKKAFSDLLLEHGIYTPSFTRLNSGVPNYPFLIRDTLSSSGGRGIHVIANEDDYSIWLNGNRGNNPWVTPFVRTKFEIRVHTYGGTILRIFKKVSEDESGRDFPIRNMHQGWMFSLVDGDKYPKVEETITSIHNIMPTGGDKIIAYDLGWDNISKRYFVFEANSAPGLNSHTADLYARCILDDLDIEVING